MQVAYSVAAVLPLKRSARVSLPRGRTLSVARLLGTVRGVGRRLSRLSLFPLPKGPGVGSLDRAVVPLPVL